MLTCNRKSSIWFWSEILHVTSGRIQYREIQHNGLFASYFQFTLWKHVLISFDAKVTFMVDAMVLNREPKMTKSCLILKTRQPYKIQKWEKSVLLKADAFRVQIKGFSSSSISISFKCMSVSYCRPPRQTLLKCNVSYAWVLLNRVRSLTLKEHRLRLSDSWGEYLHQRETK